MHIPLYYFVARIQIVNQIHTHCATVLQAKSDIGVMFCLQNYHGLKCIVSFLDCTPGKYKLVEGESDDIFIMIST